MVKTIEKDTVAILNANLKGENMNLSYWELKTWFADIDYTIIGSGIVGLSCAIQLKTRFPRAKILILEKGFLPQGASTKNAGFACFGSIGEIIDDLKTQSESQILELVRKRVVGLRLLREQLGDGKIAYKHHGGYELFLADSQEAYKECVEAIPKVNKLLSSLFDVPVFHLTSNKFRFNSIQPNLIYNKYEGQLDTGKMMASLLLRAQKLGITVLNSINVETYQDFGSGVDIYCEGIQFKTKKMFIATNGFASKLGIPRVKPARAQVLITKPIKGLDIKGTFHINKGYYYFRNIDNRILFGGGRELDFNTETTTQFGLTDRVQTRLEELLSTALLPNTPFEIDHRWSGIMGKGEDKTPIVKSVSPNVSCGVKMGGMGIAIGSLVGRELSEFV